MVDVKHIVLTNEEMIRCREFSEECAKTQQKIEFGQHTTKPRQVEEIARDNLIGKIAEVAFCKMLQENYGLHVDLDFNYYPRGQWDNQDAVINQWRIDIKGTKKGGHWMLIEWNKLNFRQRDNNLSHIFAMFTVDWNKKADQPTGVVSYQGAASLKKLNGHCPTTVILRKGSKLPETNTILQADNYGIHFKNLYKHLNTFVNYITTNTPPQSITDDYCNPYTGETTKEIIMQQSADQNRIYTEPAVQETEKQSAFQRMAVWLKSLFK